MLRLSFEWNSFRRVFSSLIDSRQSNIIGTFLDTVQDISESQLVRVLTVSFSHLTVILSNPIDYWSLATNLRLHLDASQAVELGEQLLSRFSRLLEPSQMTIDWLCALIDAHFSSFVLAKWKQLSKLRDIVEAHLLILELLQDLQAHKKTRTLTNSTLFKGFISNKRKKNEN